MTVDRLEALRQEINTVDNAIFDLLKIRNQIVVQIGAYKQMHQLPVRDVDREAEHIQAIRQAHQELDDEFIQSIVHTLTREAVRIQEDQLKLDVAD